jgi:transcriptional regulator with PAS, ATPase and Fis domain
MSTDSRNSARRHGLGRLVGDSRAMQDVYAMIRQVAPTPATVLICGESGTGKELVAQEIHALSPRPNSPFVAVNTAALPDTLIESELFGHEKGAFTGALERCAGCFERADGGTLFLDEISEMPIAMQPKLLRVLEGSKVQRLGGRTEIAVNTRILAATNRDPETSLRRDLYYRLNVFQIVLPPLRERREDIPLLAASMIQASNKKNGTRVTSLSAEVLEMFRAYHWPGNVRELRNLIERSVIVAAAGAIHAEHLPAPFSHGKSTGNRPELSNRGEALLFHAGHRMSEIKEALIKFTLEGVGNNREAAAEMLGISLRTLQTRVRDFRNKERSLVPAQPVIAIPRAGGSNTSAWQS